MDEIHKIKRCHPKCSLLLRIAVLSDKSSWRSFRTRFGALSEEVAPLLRHAHKLGLRVVGTSFHVGSKVSQSQVYRRAITAARAAFDVADELKMPKMHVLDIGGGFKANQLFDEIAETINVSIKGYFSDHQSAFDLMVMAEPGRFFAETAFTMVANVMGKRVRGEKREYWISDGIFQHTTYPLCKSHRSKF
ncbi:PREDICTED: ornithine decarboxylase [Prunus dulcis]|uniref:PREDICTED: ornithine decarboxylase n=1 Tax=Prunus dulcis TaxID=3755 RepID=A0A5E4GN92_PRUDU|nr:PREDICTED: ornithine decarboxylase [Prunus dulcis]